MATSYVFRQSFRRPQRFQRRSSVICFCVMLLVVFAEGGSPLQAHTFVPRALPYLLLVPLMLFDKPARSDGGIMVTSLDDRAMLKYGAVYEALNPEQQKDILDHYRVGNYIFPRPADQVSRSHSTREYLPQAVRIAAWSLPPLALLYWAGWHWLPSGYLRSAWTNVPVVIFVVLIFMLSLPTLLKRWNEPV